MAELLTKMQTDKVPHGTNVTLQDLTEYFDSVSTGGLIYLLDLFCNSPNPNVRDKTAELLAKMQADKLMGPRIRILLCKFLPPIFMDAMRDSHEASIHMFEGKNWLIHVKRVLI